MSSEKINTSSNRVAIYIRVSTSYQVDKDSLPMQRNDLINYCKFILNTEDYVLFEDAGYSGKNTDRPKYQEMMAQVRLGLFSHVLVWKIDRISRNLLDFASMYSELKSLGVIFMSKNEQFDTSTAMGEAMLKIILVFAELERNMTSERVTATMISRANSGQWNGGRVPYGYDYDSKTKTFTLNAEADTVRLIHDKYEELRSLIQLARYLNEMNLRTRAGNLWNPVSLDIILRNVFYSGDYRYNMLKEGDRQKPKDESEWITIKDHHPAIVSHEQKERVINILSSQKRLHIQRGSYTSKNIHVFGGVLVCGQCGSFLNSSTSNSGRKWQYSKYSCPIKRKSRDKCNQPSTSDAYIGEFVFNFILNIMNLHKKWSSKMTLEDIENSLLDGNVFSDIENIYPEDLTAFQEILSNSVENTIIYKDMPARNVDNTSTLASLRSEKQKTERALTRLTDLYLYSADSMSESEFISRKESISDKIEDINNQIGLLSSDSWEQSLSDEQFMSVASEFIISQKLTNRNYVSYKALATTVDASVIKDFVSRVIDNATFFDGCITKLVFKNGLSFHFQPKKDA